MLQIILFTTHPQRDYSLMAMRLLCILTLFFKKNLLSTASSNKDKRFWNSSHQKMQPDNSYESWVNKLCSLLSLKHVIWSASMSNSFCISISKQFLFKNIPTNVYLYNLSFSRALVWWSKRCNSNRKVSKTWQNIAFDHVWWLH